MIVTAPGYRRRQIHCPTSPRPDKVVAITLVPHRDAGDRIIKVKGLTITVEDETYVELDASGQRLTLQQYINHAKAEVFHFARDEETLRRLWLDPVRRKEMLSALLRARGSPQGIA